MARRLDQAEARCERGGTDSMTRRASTTVLFLLLLTLPARVVGQPEEGGARRVTAVRAGDRAPFDGMLVLTEDLVDLRLDLTSCEQRLRLDVQAERDRFEVLLQVERAATTAERERRELRDRLWAERAAEQAREVAALRRDARPSLWEQPLLWFAAGAAAATLVFVALR